MKHNTKIKTYPNGLEKVTICSRKLFSDSFEDNSREVPEQPFELVCKPKCMTNCSRQDSVIRARSKVFDIVAMNGFTHFVTLTISPEYHRDNPAVVRGLLRCFCSNRVQRDGLMYVLVPEYHKKGGAVHFHGFFKGGVDYADSGTVLIPEKRKPVRQQTAKHYGVPPEQWQTVYNIPKWIYGFSTAVELVGDVENVAKYITKYVTKENTKIYGNFYFAGGKGLVREVPTSFCDVAQPHLVQTEKQVYCDILKCVFKYLDSSNDADREQLELLGLCQPNEAR